MHQLHNLILSVAYNKLFCFDPGAVWKVDAGRMPFAAYGTSVQQYWPL